MNTKVPYTDILKEMISIPSTSRNEKECAGFLEGVMKSLGHNVQRIHNNLLIGNPSDDTPVNLLLNSHLDTVPPAKGWDADPFSPVEEGLTITGLGSNDAGASVVTMLAAFDTMFDRMGDRINLMLLISAEEEVSGDKGISAVLPLLGTLDGVIVGEPTGMQPAVAERGLMVLDGEVTGRAGHAARSEGVNAIYLAMEDVVAIRELAFAESSVWLPDPGAHVTMISAGTGHNVVPDNCSYVVDVRSNDRYGNETLLELISGVCQASLVPRSTRLKPSHLEKDHLLMKTSEACGLVPFGSSTLSDMALIPFPALKMGPGDSARSHTAGEYILRTELDAGFEGYCTFLRTMQNIVEKKH